MRQRVVVVRLAVALVALLSVFGVGRASSVRPANLIEIVDAAQVAFVGTCTGIEPGVNPQTGSPEVLYTFRVEKYLKGGNSDPVLSFRQYGPVWDKTKPQYHKGQRVALFLYGASRLGYTSAVARQQGAFDIRRNGDEQGVVNAVENRDLFRGVAAQTAQQSFQLNAAESQVIRQGGAIPIELFTSLVEKIRRAPASARQRFYLK